jgi:hypothetical protein
MLKRLPPLHYSCVLRSIHVGRDVVLRTSILPVMAAHLYPIRRLIPLQQFVLQEARLYGNYQINGRVADGGGEVGLSLIE